MFDICILGGGIIGTTIALACARRDLSVCIVERDTVLLRGSTLAGFGALTPYSDPYFVGEAALFAESSLMSYRGDWLNFLNRRTEIRVPLSKSGLLQIAPDREYLTKHKLRYDDDCIPGYRPEYLNYAELMKVEPKLTIDAVGAIYHPEPWIDLQTYMSAIEQCVQTFSNITIFSGEFGRSVSESAEHVDIGLSSGRTARAKQVVVATGLSHEAVEGVESFEIRWIRGDGVAVRTKDNLPIFRNNIYCSPGFIAPRNTGEMLLGSTYIDEGVGDNLKLARDRNRITFGSLAQIVDATRKISNHLDDCDLEREWHGWRPCSPNELPIFGTVPERNRTIYALGFLGLGITMSVAVGDAVATYVDTGKPVFPVSMSPQRFSS